MFFLCDIIIIRSGENKLPKLLVIIPCYNQAQYILDAVNSVKESSFKDVEIIVINNGSTDISKENFDKLLVGYDNLKIIHQGNLGVCKARNSGIDAASGEYILPLDADDKIAPTYIEQAVKILDANENIGVVYCEAEYFGAKSGKLNLKPATVKNMLTQNRIFATSMFRKSDFTKFGGYKPDGELGCEDWDLWLSFIENGYEIYQIPEILFYYRKHPNTRTEEALKFHKYLKIRKNIIKSHKELYKKYFWQIILPMAFFITKNGAYNIKTYIINFKKILRRIYYKAAINVFNLYPDIKRINKTKLQEVIDTFLKSDEKRAAETAEGIIVSMTSIPDRMYDIHYAIFSIITQSIKPEKFILYLGKDKFPNGEADIPEQVLAFKPYGLEFRFVEDVRSFTKLIPALEEFPDKTIVTADYDIFYETDWLKNLIETHKKYPEDIIVHKHKNIKLDSESKPLPYRNWTDKKEKDAAFSNLLMGVGGVLYPANSLYKDVNKKNLFLSLCPTNDDIWFYAMAVLNGTKIRISENSMANLTIVNIERELNLNNEPTLYKSNRVCQNDIQFNNILGYYENLKELYERKN